MIIWNIKAMLEEKGVLHKYQWLRKVKVSPNVASKILTGKQERLTLDIVNNICEAAYCTPNDLFVWQPDANKIIDENHPLQKLRARSLANINHKLKTLSPEQIIELGKIVDGMK